MTLLHDSPDSATTGSAPQRFRAATVEEALTDARGELGPDVEIVDANRIRRGGVGGFFATDLGVELAIRPTARPNGTVTSLAHHLADHGRDLDRDRSDRDDTHDRDHEARPDDHDFADRLAALDHAIYGDGATSGLERLLQRAAGNDDFERAGDTIDAPPRTDAQASFAEHLERLEHGPHPLPRRHRTALPLESPAEHTSESERAESEVPERPTNRPADGSPQADRTDVQDVVAGTYDRMCDDSEHAAPTANEGSQVAPRSRPFGPIGGHQTISELPVGRQGRPSEESNRSDVGQHADLAADAVGRLITELTRVTPVDGSRANQLSRLTVSVTSADGSSIELAAELNGSNDG